MGTYFESIWKCRRFWLNLVINDLQLRYRRSVLGVGWSLLFPVLTTLVLGAVFHEIFHVPICDFLPFLLSGLSFWAYITGATLEGCQSYVQAESYIRQHPLPLAIYPLRTTLGQLIHFLIALVVVFVFVLVLQGSKELFALVYLVPGLVLLFFFGWAVGVLFGFLNTVFRDTQHLLQLAFYILFYLTPIIYPGHTIFATRVGWVVRYNPLLYYLELVRNPLLAGQPPSHVCFAITGACTLLLSVAALATLHYQQRHVILHL